MLALFSTQKGENLYLSMRMRVNQQALPIPDSRFPIPDSRFPTPYSLLPPPEWQSRWGNI
ncbi:MAG: hypothetical protein F6K50_21865 [Moorea sp. SIO3I7]|nr:hypothetical protein [Moorena sp. SIO3I7]NEO47711.1 hypothetical protein [Moorena sp. SIO4A3]NEO61613.1 hypothetical protein [Moorena sp. SIO4G2]